MIQLVIDAQSHACVCLQMHMLLNVLHLHVLGTRYTYDARHTVPLRA